MRSPYNQSLSVRSVFLHKNNLEAIPCAGKHMGKQLVMQPFQVIIITVCSEESVCPKTVLTFVLNFWNESISYLIEVSLYRAGDNLTES
jgi:hypothetical protein